MTQPFPLEQAEAAFDLMMTGRVRFSRRSYDGAIGRGGKKGAQPQERMTDEKI
jgi:hypothetical protein